MIRKNFGQPKIDLFASSLCHQLKQHVTWKSDPNSIGTNSMQQNWNLGLGYSFPPFCMISQVLAKVIREKVEHLIIVNPVSHILICSIALHINTKSTLVTTEGKSFCESIESNASSDNKKYININVMESFRQSLRLQAISSKASKLISKSRRPGTISYYD